MTEVRKGKEIEDIKPCNRSMGQIMQNKIGEVMRKNLNKRPTKRNIRKNTDDDKCWDLHNKVFRLNRTEPSMLTLNWKRIYKNRERWLQRQRSSPEFQIPTENVRIITCTCRIR